MLTHQQRKYAENRASGMNKKQSAIAAGCPEKTASQAASRYERDPEVRAHMERLQSAEAGEMTFDCPLEFMRHMMNREEEEPKLRLDAAKALASYTVAKPGEKGKKEEQKEAAKRVAGSSKFGVQAAPLRSVK